MSRSALRSGNRKDPTANTAINRVEPLQRNRHSAAGASLEHHNTVEEKNRTEAQRFLRLLKAVPTKNK